MKRPSKNWYVITGAPGTGKSTLIAELAKRGYKTFAEVGRWLIDEDMRQGKTLEQIQVDSPEFELRFAELQYERESQMNPEELIFFDRGILDTLPFHEYYNWPVPSIIKKYCDESAYAKTVFLLDTLDNYDQDFNRIETREISEGLQKLAGKAYREHGYTVISVPPVSVEERITILLKYVEGNHGES